MPYIRVKEFTFLKRRPKMIEAEELGNRLLRGFFKGLFKENLLRS
jgi:hypothetical protein